MVAANIFTQSPPHHKKASYSPAYAILVKTSSHQRHSVRKSVLRNFTKFTGEHLYQSLYFNTKSSLRPATLSKSVWPKCFPDFVLLETLITELSELIATTKVLYYENLAKKTK